MRHLLKEVVGGISGLKVSGTAGNVAEAQFEIRKNRPDLVLLDEVLPGESALAFLGELSEEEQLPVILLTGLEKPEHALPAQARDRLVKPGWDTIEEDRVRMRELIFRALNWD